MTPDELQALLREIQFGRTEGDSLEWKRQWWNLSSSQGKAEFRRDIASLANSARGNGMLILGLKEGRLYEALPPLDEAELQQILDAIVPTPKVVIDTIAVEGTAVSVLTIAAPFDRPYVSPWNNLNVVFVRHGSSIDTATRFELDAFYAAQRRRPALGAEWQFWKPGEFATENHNWNRSTILSVVPPEVRTTADVRSIWTRRLETLRSSCQREGYPTSEQLRSYEVQLAAFFGCIESPDLFRHWFKTSYKFSASTPFTAVLRNKGTLPATDVKLQVNFPDWLLLLDELDDEPVPERYVAPPATPPRPPPPLTPYEQLMHALQSPIRDFSRFDVPALPRIQSIHKESGAWLDAHKTRAIFSAKRLLHAHLLTADDTLHVLALPGAPSSPEPIPLRARLFSAEQERWLPIELSVQLVHQP